MMCQIDELKCFRSVVEELYSEDNKNATKCACLLAYSAVHVLFNMQGNQKLIELIIIIIIIIIIITIIIIYLFLYEPFER